MRHQDQSSFLALLVLALTLLPSAPPRAQTTIVSPVTAAQTEGSVGNYIPFRTDPSLPRFIRRYLQIHDDLGPGTKVITQLRFRANEGISNFTGTTTIDLEMWMGLGRPLEQTSQFFDANYQAGTRQQTMPLTRVNFGPQGQLLSPGPNPFIDQQRLILNVPFSYPGTASLVWEVKVRGGSQTGVITSLDADEGSYAQSTSARIGSGCLVSGRTQPMGLTLEYWDCGGILQLNHQVTNAPGNAPTMVAFGARDPGWQLPGLCSPIHTDLLAVLPIGTTTPSGEITEHMAGLATLVLPNTLGGAQLFVQAHAIDLGSANPIPLANSAGETILLPAPQTAKVVRIARIWNNVGGADATEGMFGQNTNIGYGLVTEFTY